MVWEFIWVLFLLSGCEEHPIMLRWMSGAAASDPVAWSLCGGIFDSLGRTSSSDLNPFPDDSSHDAGIGGRLAD